jgi:Asp-tRNA(Asn)/Glu-tRNA(Gln) amidotransferase A subunit family amidase
LEKTTGADGKARNTKPKRIKPPATDPTQNKASARPEGIIPEVRNLLAGTVLDTAGYFSKIKDFPPNEQYTAAKRDLGIARQRKGRMRPKAEEPHQIDLEYAIAAKDPAETVSVPTREEINNLANEALEAFRASTVESIKADLLRFSDEDLEELRRAIEEEIADRAAMAAGGKT